MPETKLEPASRPYLPPAWLACALAALLVVTLIFWGRFLIPQTSVVGYAYKRDFLSVYIGARAVAEHRGSQLYDFDMQRALMNAAILPYQRNNLLPYIYPPYVAAWLSPLGALSLARAFLVWTVLNLAATVWLAWRLSRYFVGSVRLRAAVVIAVLAWVPLQLTLSHGQLGMLSAVALAETLLALGASRQWRAGGWLALGLCKPHLLAFPLLVLLLWRCWRALAAFLTAVVLVVGASFLRLGFWIPEYLRFIVGYNRKGVEVSLYPMAMQNWRGLVYALFGSDGSRTAHLCIAALSAGSVIAVLLLCFPRGSRPSAYYNSSLPPHWEARLAMAMGIGILASPYLYLHDWVAALPAGVALFAFAGDQAAGSHGREQWSAKVLVWMIALAPFVCFAVQFGGWPRSSPVQLEPWYMAMLAGVGFVAVRSEEPAPLKLQADFRS